MSDSPRGLWVTTGPGLPVGARCLDRVLRRALDGRTWLDVCILGQHLPQMYPVAEIHELEPEGRTWLDVCILGQHLPQMYPVAEIHELEPEGCARLGLCPDCLGFGDMSVSLPVDVMLLARGIDEVPEPCPGCGGSGRALRITVERGPGSVTGSITPLPHQYVPPLEETDPELCAAFGTPEGTCLACGMPQDGKGPGGEELHQ